MVIFAPAESLPSPATLYPEYICKTISGVSEKQLVKYFLFETIKWLSIYQIIMNQVFIYHGYNAHQVMCLDIHPDYPNMIAIGLYDGNVAVSSTLNVQEDIRRYVPLPYKLNFPDQGVQLEAHRAAGLYV